MPPEINFSKINFGLIYYVIGTVMKSKPHGTIMRDNGFAMAHSGVTYYLFSVALEYTLPEKYVKPVSAGVTFALCSIAEIVQSFNIPWVNQHKDFFGSVFDPKDFIAYAIGIGTAYGIDVLTDYTKKNIIRLEHKITQKNNKEASIDEKISLQSNQHNTRNYQ